MAIVVAARFRNRRRRGALTEGSGTRGAAGVAPLGAVQRGGDGALRQDLPGAGDPPRVPGGAGLLLLHRAGGDQQAPRGVPAGHPAAADAVVQPRRGGGGGAGARGRLPARVHRHLAGGHPADHRAHPLHLPARAQPHPQPAHPHRPPPPSEPAVPAAGRLQEHLRQPPRRRAGRGGPPAAALPRAGGAGAAGVAGADPRGHPLARDVARGARGGVAHVLWRAERRRHALHPRPAARGRKRQKQSLR
eukprot:1194677-Prorocentrum_minimum.AAC.2